MNKKFFCRENRMVLAGILALILFVAAAFLIPRISFACYDRKLTAVVADMDSSVDSYQIQYSSFMEKLKCIGSYYATKQAMEVTYIQEASDEEMKERLTDMAVYELSDMESSGNGMDIDFLYSDCAPENLLSASLYLGYPADGDLTSTAGISYWKLVYDMPQLEKEWGMDAALTFTILLDAEFQKIYALQMDVKWLDDKQDTDVWTWEMETGYDETEVIQVSETQLDLETQETLLWYYAFSAVYNLNEELSYLSEYKSEYKYDAGVLTEEIPDEVMDAVKEGDCVFACSIDAEHVIYLKTEGQYGRRENGFYWHLGLAPLDDFLAIE